MSKKFEVTAITGKYTDNNGQEKSRYQTIGVVVESKNGLMLKLESVPIGWDGWAYLNDPKPREGQQAPQQRQQSRPAQRSSGGHDDMDSSDIPFNDPMKSRAFCLATL